jgi:hypothetical protein
MKPYVKSSHGPLLGDKQHSKEEGMSTALLQHHCLKILKMKWPLL